MEENEEEEREEGGGGGEGRDQNWNAVFNSNGAELFLWAKAIVFVH